MQPTPQPQCLIDVQCAMDKHTCGAHQFIQDEEMCALSLDPVTKSACRCAGLGDHSGNCTLLADDKTHSGSLMKASRTEHSPDRRLQYRPRQQEKKTGGKCKISACHKLRAYTRAPNQSSSMDSIAEAILHILQDRLHRQRREVPS